MERQRRVAEMLLEVDALKFDGANPFVYASRKLGPVYVDLRRLSSSPALWAQVVGELASAIEAEVGLASFQVVSGGEVADLLFSIPIAIRFKKPHVVIRKTAKTHGLGGRTMGRLERGQRVVHVSDLITSGTSALDWVGVIRAEGGDVGHYFVVVDRKQGGTEALDAVGVKVHSLVELDARLVKMAAEKDLIEENGAKGILSYLEEPEKWAENLLLSRPEILTQNLAAEGGKLIRREGVEILTIGYPELVAKLGNFVREKLRSLGVEERIDSLGYAP